MLEALAADMDKTHRRVHISTMVGSSTGIVGGVMATAGLVAAMFTLGGSLLVTAIGFGMSAAGGLTSLGASLADFGITMDRCKSAQKLLDKDREATESVFEALLLLAGKLEVCSRLCAYMYAPYLQKF